MHDQDLRDGGPDRGPSTVAVAVPASARLPAAPPAKLRTVRGWLLSLIGLGFIVGWVLLAAQHRAQGLDAAEACLHLKRRPATCSRPADAGLCHDRRDEFRAGPLFQPAEIDFLFAGPFSRRGCLLYNFAGYAVGAFISALCVLLVVPMATSSGPRFLGTS